MGAITGRPPFDADPKTRRIVEALAATAATRLDIAEAINTTRPTLNKHFRAEIERGRAEGRRQARKAAVLDRLAVDLLRIAGGRRKEPALTATIVMLRRLGW